jgi:uncharacterized protein YbjQ (UPF0145 family)
LISIEGADWVTGAYIFIRRLLIHDTNDVERSHGLHLARIVRQEGLERILAIARQRGANAIINFQYQNRLKPKEDEEDEPIVEIAATGLACVLKRQLTDWELEMKRQAELSKQASHIAVYS